MVTWPVRADRFSALGEGFGVAKAHDRLGPPAAPASGARQKWDADPLRFVAARARERTTYIRGRASPADHSGRLRWRHRGAGQVRISIFGYNPARDATTSLGPQQTRRVISMAAQDERPTFTGSAYLSAAASGAPSILGAAGD